MYEMNRGQEANMRTVAAKACAGTMRGLSDVATPLVAPTFSLLCADIHNEISAIEDRHGVAMRAIRRLRNPRPTNECEDGRGDGKVNPGVTTLEFDLSFILQRLRHLGAESTEIADELNAVI